MTNSRVALSLGKCSVLSPQRPAASPPRHQSLESCLRTAHPPPRQRPLSTAARSSVIFVLVFFPLHTLCLSAFRTPLCPSNFDPFSTLHTTYRIHTMSLQPPSEPIGNLKDPGAHELPGVPKITGNQLQLLPHNQPLILLQSPKSPMTTSLMPQKAPHHTPLLSLAATVPCRSPSPASRK